MKAAEFFQSIPCLRLLIFLLERKKLENALKQKIEFQSHIDAPVDFGAIKGQESAKEAAIISAAGGHNLLLVGPPGEGKSAFGKRYSWHPSSIE